MSRLVDKIPGYYSNAVSRSALFGGDSSERVLRNQWEPREQPNFGKPGNSCKYNLFFGFSRGATKARVFAPAADTGDRPPMGGVGAQAALRAWMQENTA